MLKNRWAVWVFAIVKALLWYIENGPIDTEGCRASNSKVVVSSPHVPLKSNSRAAVECQWVSSGLRLVMCCLFSSGAAGGLGWRRAAVMIFRHWLCHAVATSSLLLSSNKKKKQTKTPLSWGRFRLFFSSGLLRAIVGQIVRWARRAPSDNKCCPGSWYLKMLFFLCGFSAASWPRRQDFDRWPTGHKQQGLLVPSACHICFTPRLQLPGDCFYSRASWPSPWLHSPACLEPPPPHPPPPHRDTHQHWP